MSISSTVFSKETSSFGFVLPYQEEGDFEKSSIKLALNHSNLAAIHMDQTIPWNELLSNKPLPKWLVTSLKNIKAQIPKNFKISLAVTPTSTDRASLSPSSAPYHHSQSLPIPKELKNKKFDDPLIKKLFLKYVNCVTEIIEPDYLNIGIEISELAVKKPEKWNEYKSLFLYLLLRIKKKHPHIKIGMEMVLQSFMEPDVQSRVLQTFIKGDFLGFSFYPYGSIMSEKAYKHQALQKPPKQWSQGFEFMSKLSKKYRKPIAFCETGYLSSSTTSYGIDLIGSEKLQTDFTRDLIKFSSSHNPLFVIWFVPLDYHQALISLPNEFAEFKEAGKIWSYSGLWNEDKTPKLALSEWKKGLK